MSRFFVLPGFLVPVLHAFRDPGTNAILQVYGTTDTVANFPGPWMPTKARAWTLCEVQKVGALRVAYISKARGYLVVQADDIGSGARLVDAAHGVLNLVAQVPPNPVENPRAVEVTGLPEPSWTDTDLRDAVHTADSPHDLPSRTATVLQHRELAGVGALLPRALGDPYLATALRHLAYSQFLWCFQMGGSYYHFHYRHDRVAMTDEDLERDYMLNRPLFELSFVSAYRGLEAVLGQHSIKKAKCSDALEAGVGVSPGDIWKSRHQVLGGRSAETTYLDLMKHFADVRNTVAAHAGVVAPEDKRLNRDVLLEAQLFLDNLCWKRFGNIPPSFALPDEAYAAVSVVHME